MTLSFCLLDTLWQNFSKINSTGGGGGVWGAAVGFEMKFLEKLIIYIFCLVVKLWKCRVGYNFVPEKMFSGIKRVNIELR